jgi:hypothetical protein
MSDGLVHRWYIAGGPIARPERADLRRLRQRADAGPRSGWAAPMTSVVPDHGMLAGGRFGSRPGDVPPRVTGRVRLRRSEPGCSGRDAADPDAVRYFHAVDARADGPLVQGRHRPRAGSAARRSELRGGPGGLDAGRSRGATSARHGLVLRAGAIPTGVGPTSATSRLDGRGDRGPGLPRRSAGRWKRSRRSSTCSLPSAWTRSSSTRRPNTSMRSAGSPRLSSDPVYARRYSSGRSASGFSMPRSSTSSASRRSTRARESCTVPISSANRLNVCPRAD